MTQQLVVQSRPFEPGQTMVVEVEAGYRVTDLVRLANVPEALWSHLRVEVGDQVIPRDRWHLVRAKPGVTVYVRLVPQGEGGKDVLRVVLTLAVVVAAAVFAPGIGGALANALNITSAAGITAVTSFVTAGLTFAGIMALNALLPPPSRRFGRAEGDRVLTGTNNRIARYEPIPRVFGKVRIYPVVAGLPYTESQGDKQYLRLLLTAGYGPLRITDLRIGETPISAFNNVQVEIHEGGPSGWPGNRTITLYNRRVREESLSVLLEPGGTYTDPDSGQVYVDGWVTRTSFPEAVELNVEVACPQGLVTITKSGDYETREVKVAVQYRATGTAGAWLNADWIDDGSQPGFGTDGIITINARALEPIRRTGRWTVPEGQYDVRVRRITSKGDARDVDAIAYTALRTLSADEPVLEPGVSLIALRMKATDQFNGVPNTISCIAESYLPVRNPDFGTWTYQISRNPAWAYADVFRRRGSEVVMADSRLDFASLHDWADACAATAPNADEPRWTFDHVFEGGSIFEAARQIAAMGRATFAMRDGRFGVVRDKLQTVPVQHITPRNSWGYSGSKNFPKVPHALRMRFQNAAKGYADDEVIVYADGYSEETANEFETIDLLGCTSATLAWREGRYILAAGLLRPETHRVSMDVENLRCTQGDLVQFAHDVIAVGLAHGRVVSRQLTGGNITHLTLDQLCVMEAGKTYALRARLANGATRYMPLVLAVGASETVQLAVPLADLDGPQNGDLCMFGESALESAPCIVRRIEAGPDLTATLTLVDAADGVHTADTGVIPPFDSRITIEGDYTLVRPEPPSFALRSNGTVVDVLPDGTTTYRIAVDIIPPAPMAGSVIDSYRAQFRQTGADEQWYGPGAVSSDTRTIYLAPVRPGAHYDVRLQAITDTGVVSEWQEVTNYEVIGKDFPPAQVTGLATAGAYRAVVLSWAAVDDFDVAYYEVRYSAGTDPAAAGIAGTVAPSKEPSFLHTGVEPGVTRNYWVRAVDLSENEGEWSAMVAGTAAGVPWSDTEGAGRPEDGATRNNPAGEHNSALAYNKGDIVSWTDGTSSIAYIAKSDVPAGTAVTNTVYWDKLVEGGGGAAGAAAISGLLTDPLISVTTEADGSGGTFVGLGGTFRVFDGSVEKTTSGQVTYSVTGAPAWAAINSSGVYAITGDWGAEERLRLEAVYGGVTIRLTVALVKVRKGAAGVNVRLATPGGQAFTFVDGLAEPAGQSLTFTVERLNGAVGAAVFTTSPAVTLTGTGDSRTMSAAAFGSNRQVRVVATVGSLVDETVVVRLDDTTAEPGATVGAPSGTAVGGMPVEQLALGSDTSHLDAFSQYPDRETFGRAWFATRPGADASLVKAAKFAQLSPLVNSPGGKGILLGDNSLSDDITIQCYRAMPYSPEDLYCLEVEYEPLEVGTGLFYAGVIMTDANGNVLSGNGSHLYVAVASEGALNTARRIKRGYIRGVGTDFRPAPNLDNPATAAVGTVSLRMIFLHRFANDGQTVGRTILHRMALWKVEDTTIIPRGDWSALVSYGFNDAVEFGERSFLSRRAGNIGNQPPSDNSSDAFWMLLGGRGATGDAGLPGADGASTFTLTGNGTLTFPAPDRVLKDGGVGAWNNNWSSQQSYPSGIMVEAVVGAGAAFWFIGIAQTPTLYTDVTAYTHLDAGIYMNNGILRHWTSGIQHPDSGVTAVQGDRIGVRYNGVDLFEFLKNGVVFATRPATAGLTMFAKGTIFSPNINVDKITITSIGARGAPGTEGRDAITAYSEEPPASPQEGDTWYKLSTKEWFRRTGPNWVKLFGSFASVEQLTAANVASLIADGALPGGKIDTIPSVKVTGQLTDAQIQAVAAAKVAGQLTDAQIASIAAAKVAGQLTNEQIAAIASTKITGQLTDAQIASIAAAKVAGLLTNEQIASIAAAKVAGQLTSSQIASIEAAKVAGQLTSSQIASIEAAKVAGQLTNEQIASIAAAKVAGQLTSSQIASIDAAKVAGQITDAQIASIAAAKVAGQLVEGQIAAGAITASKISAEIGGSNLCLDSSFEANTWFVYNNTGNATGRLEPGRNGGLARVTTAGSSVGVTLGSLRPDAIVGGWETGRFYVISFYARTPNATGLTGMGLGWNSGPQSQEWLSNPVPSSTWQRYVRRVRWNPGAPVPSSSGRGSIWISAAGSWSPGHEIWLDDVQVEAGEVVTAYAPKTDEILPGTIGSDELKAGAVVAGKVAAGAVTAGTIAAGAVQAGTIAANAVTANTIQSGAVTAGKLDAGAVTAGTVAAGAVTAGTIAAGAVTALTIQGGAVTAGKLDAGAVTAGTIAADAVTADNIAAGAVKAGKLDANAVTAGTIAANAVTAGTIQSGAVTAGKLSAGSVLAGNIAAGAVEAGNLSANAVTAGTIAAGAVTAGTIQSGAVTAGKLDAGAVLADNIAANAVTAGKLDAGAVTAGTIAAGAVTAGNIAANAVTAGTIQSGAVTAGKLNAGAVLADNIAANAVTAGKLSAGSVLAGNIAAGAVTVGTIAANAVTAGTIAANAVQAGKLDAGAVTAGTIAAGAVTAGTIASDAVTADTIAANAVTADAIAANAVTAAKILAGTITGDKIFGGTITGSKIAAGTIAAINLSSTNLITASAQIADGIITDAKIANLSAGKITTGLLAAQRILLDGITLSANGSGQLLVNNAGISTSELATNAVASLVNYHEVNVSGFPFEANNTWRNVQVNSKVCLVTLSNTAPYAAKVRLDVCCMVEQEGSQSDTLNMRISWSGGGSGLLQEYSSIDIGGGGGRRTPVTMPFLDVSLPAGTTRTYTLQALASVGLPRFASVDIMATMFKRS